MHRHLLDMVMMVVVLEDQTTHQVAVVQEARTCKHCYEVSWNKICGGGQLVQRNQVLMLLVEVVEQILLLMVQQILNLMQVVEVVDILTGMVQVDLTLVLVN